MHLNSRLFIVAAGSMIAFFTSLPLNADPASDLKQLTGAHTRVVWGQYKGAGDGNMRLVGLDTDDGKGERILCDETYGYSVNFFTHDGSRVVTASRTTHKTHVVDWNGDGKKQFVTDGVALDYYYDAATKVEWIYVTPSYGGNSSTLKRVNLNNPSQSQTVFSGSVSYCFVQVSGDGKRAAACAPWPNTGIIDLTTGHFTQYRTGCFPGISPDDQYRVWIFENNHRTVHMYDKSGVYTGAVSINMAPGINGAEVYFPKWSNVSEYVSMAGPHPLGVGQDGSKAEIYVGKFNTSYNSIGDWVKLTSNTTEDGFNDVWIATSSALPDMGISPTSLNFTAVLGATVPTAQNVIVTAENGLSLENLTATSPASWLDIGISGTGNTRTLENAINMDGLLDNDYNTTVTVKKPNRLQRRIA